MRANKLSREEIEGWAHCGLCGAQMTSDDNKTHDEKCVLADPDVTQHVRLKPCSDSLAALRTWIEKN